MTGCTTSTGVKHLRAFDIFALTSISFKDFRFLIDMKGGSLKICLSRGCSSMICHFSIKTGFIFVSLCDKRAKYLLFLARSLRNSAMKEYGGHRMKNG